MKVAIRTARVLRVPVDHVRRNVGLGRSINQLVQMIKPELERQQRQKFKAAIIEMFPKGGRPPRIRFDENAPFEVQLHKHEVTPAAVGKSFAELGWTVEDVKDVAVPQGSVDPSAGHAFLIRMGEVFLLAFDFRYNRADAQAKIVRAKEYLAGCKRMDPHRDYFLACYALWSAYELITDAIMLSLPNSDLPKPHDKKLSNLERTRKGIRVVSDTFMAMFQRLIEIKPAARYPGHSTDPKWKKLSRRSSALIRKALVVARKELRTNAFLRRTGGQRQGA